MTDEAKDIDDLPYEPVARDRKAERARAEKIPGYTEARKLTGSLLDAALCSSRSEAQAIIERADEASLKLSGTYYGFKLPK